MTDRSRGVVLVKLDRAIARSGDVGLAISALAVAAITLLTTVEVIGRDVFDVSTLISDEMGAYLLVVVAFLGLAGTLRTGGFIRIDMYRARFSGEARRALDVAIHALAAAYTAVLDWYLWAFMANAYRHGTTSIQITQTPLWIPYSVMFAGGVLLLLEIIAGGCRAAAGRDNAHGTGRETV